MLPVPIQFQYNGSVEPKTEPNFDESNATEKVQQQTQNQQQNQVVTSQANQQTTIDANGNGEGKDEKILMTVLVPSGGLTEYRENGRNLNELTGENQNQNFRDTSNRNIVTEQIVWIPKIPPQSQQDGNHQATTYSRIKQLNYSQVEHTKSKFKSQNKNEKI